MRGASRRGSYLIMPWEGSPLSAITGLAELRVRSKGKRFPLLGWHVVLMLAALAPTAAWALEQSVSPASQPVLRLANGKSTAGNIQPSTGSGILRWRNASTGSESDFAWSEVNAIEWPALGTQPKPTGEVCFELAGGDILFGSLVAMGDQWAELDVPRLGRISIQRAKLYRIHRSLDGGDLVYLGPNGLIGWRDPTGQENWHQESGRPMTDRQECAIRGDFRLPDRAIIEFEISWKSRPDFLFALGVDDTENTVHRALRFGR